MTTEQAAEIIKSLHQIYVSVIVIQIAVTAFVITAMLKDFFKR
jgi:hypothetical protein